jgi:hypothetical protein
MHNESYFQGCSDAEEELNQFATDPHVPTNAKVDELEYLKGQVDTLKKYMKIMGRKIELLIKNQK